jgi:hypothetical protein
MKRLCLIFAAALAAFTLAPSAQALSCMAPDIERELSEAIESEKIYHIFVGYFDAPQIPRKDIDGSDPFIMEDRSQTVHGYFSGVSLAKTRRSDVPLRDLPVTIKTNCAAHWCGQVPHRDQKMIAFVEAQAGGPPLLTMGPCPHMSHSYSDEKISLLRRGL